MININIIINNFQSLVSSILGQESKSAKIMEGFKNLVPQYALVRRNGGEKITVTIQITIIACSDHYTHMALQWHKYVVVS